MGRKRHHDTYTPVIYWRIYNNVTKLYYNRHWTTSPRLFKNKSLVKYALNKIKNNDSAILRDVVVQEVIVSINSITNLEDFEC